MEERATTKIIEGDCFDELTRLPSASFDAIVTDPPYAIPTIVAAGRSSTVSIGDLSMPERMFRTLFAEFERLLKPTGRFFVFCDGVSYPVIFRAAYGQFSSALLVWDKGRIGMGREFRKSHELIMHCWKPNTPIFSDGTGRPDVLKAKPCGDDREHAAQKPVDLIEQLLTVCGDNILDPFMGSGSVGIACMQGNRNFTGIEIEPRFCDVARRRLEATMPQLSLSL